MWWAWLPLPGISAMDSSFCAKWGIVTGTKARKRTQAAAITLSVLLALVGLITIFAFVSKSPTSNVIRHGISPESGVSCGTEPNDSSKYLKQPGAIGPAESEFMATTTPRIIIVGGGLAGLSAAIKVAESGAHVDLFSLVPVKRSHSVCAQGGINAAKNLKGEGDSTWNHFDDTVYGGDFLANQAPVKQMCEMGPGIIDLLDRMGVPFNRTPEGCSISAASEVHFSIEPRLLGPPPASSFFTRWMNRCAALSPKANPAIRVLGIPLCRA